MESSESEDQEIAGDVATEKQEKEEVTGQDLVMKAEGIEVVDGAPSVSGASTITGKNTHPDPYQWFHVADPDCDD